MIIKVLPSAVSTNETENNNNGNNNTSNVEINNVSQDISAKIIKISNKGEVTV